MRDGEAALPLAQRAAEANAKPNAAALEALAATHAERGDFTAAIEWQERALAAAGGGPREQDARKRLALYEEGLPYRAPGGAE